MFDIKKIKDSAYLTKNKDLFESLKTSENGLTGKQVEKRKEYKNILFEIKTPSALEIFLRQFNRMTFILIVASAIAFFIHHYLDAIGIFIAALTAMFFGFIQEYKAEEQLKYLYQLTKPKAKVMRDKKVQMIDSTEIVPGDILILTSGDLIPADCKILLGENVLVDQAILTGESEPVQKSSLEITEKREVAERENILYAGTHILKGDVKALVIATGKFTEFGKITSALTTIKQEPSELSKDLEKLGDQLVKISVFLVVVIFLLGIEKNIEINDLLISSILLFVAAIPEGLPTVLAITLAYGVKRLAQQNAIVRKLSAISSIGKVSLICADKTGTLTKNQLKIVKIFSCLKEYENIGLGDLKELKNDKKIKKIIETAILASKIIPKKKEIKKEEMESFGDPLEAEIGRFYQDLGYDTELLYSKYQTQAEFPFDFKRRSACYVRKRKDQKKVMIEFKGAPEEVLLFSTHYLDENMEIKRLSKEILIELEERVKFYSLQAIRTIAVAYKEEDLEPTKKYKFEKCSSNLIFIGLIGFFDQPVEGVEEAIEQAKQAGISIIMITGDSPHTAMAVSKQIGLVKENELQKLPILGSELEKMSDEKIVEKFLEAKVCARASPEHKLKIVSAFQNKGYIVALTGDGVNDAPALKKANVSIAIGKGGSEVAKSVSDIILVDNNLRTIIRAIEYSKAIFLNIRSFVSYQLTTNLSALSLMFFAQFLNFGVVLKPLELLWINLVMDGPPALALGLEKPKKDVLKPVEKNDQIVNKEVLFTMLCSVVFIVSVSLIVFENYVKIDRISALSNLFNIFVLLQLANAFAVRSSGSFLREISSNKYLLAAVGGVLIVHIAIFNTEILREFFGVRELDLNEWITSFAIILVFLVYTDFIKIIKKKIFK